ncbi:MAG: undecaprenyl-phosphate glucose phosphotransferase [Hyphomicrobiales bacterium]|nr:undecaprenyl-phosphate glucose phosphotransferase [Hyphomicrobiales bacterium]
MLEKPETETRINLRSLLPPLSATKVATFLMITDTVAILGAGYFTYDSLIVYSLSQNLYLAAVIFVWITTLSLMNFVDLYRYETATRPLRHLHKILIALATSFLFLLAAAFSIKVSETFSRLWLAWFAVSSGMAIVLFRAGMSLALVHLLHVGGSKRNLAIVGAGEQSRRLLAALDKDTNHPIRVYGVFDDTLRPVTRFVAGKEISVPPDHGLQHLMSQARLGMIDDVVIAIPWQQDDRIMTVVARLRELPVNVYLLSDLVGFRTKFRSPPSHFGTLPILQVVGKPMSGWDAVMKAVEDYTLAPLVLLVSFPLLVVIAAAVKLDSPGPVLFRQKRVGFNNQVFNVCKFRSMQHTNVVSDKTQQTTPDDLRVTRVGRFLRRWSLDELPQIFNVLNGTMSLVGPRPHALDHNEEFAKRTMGYFARHRVKPGITGLAQVNGFRGATDTEDKLDGRVRNDIYYAENWSLTLDLRILLRTLVICLTGKNAY